MKFDLGYTNSRSCAPSRARLISSRYQTRLPIGTGEGGGIDYWSHDLVEPGHSGPGTPDLFEDETPIKVEGYATDLLTDKACDFIKRNASQPFMLSLHYTAPHWP